MNFYFSKIYLYTGLVACVLFCFNHGLQAQNTINGKVKGLNSQGEAKPLFAAQIHWMGTDVGTTTNLKGEFSLPHPEGAHMLIISHLSYQDDTIHYAGQQLNIELMASDGMLEETDVTGQAETSFTDHQAIQKMNMITEGEFNKAACCNLSESFETNPSVDVAYADAVTGIRHIEMLGLAGTYANLSTEMMPDLRGFASNTGLDLIPSTWIESMQVSKGVGSVKNGYESITGQINIELQKPHEADDLFLNLFVNQGGRTELNANIRHKISYTTKALTMLHASALPTEFDVNHDGFLDMPKTRRLAAAHRWVYRGLHGWMGQAGVKMFYADRIGGQTGYDSDQHRLGTEVFGYESAIRRAQAWGKVGYLWEDKPYKSVGFQWSGTWHDQQSTFGTKEYNGTQRTLYLNLLYQTIIGSTLHQIVTGASYLLDGFDERFDLMDFERTESAPGAFAEYTFNQGGRFSAVAGLRADYHNLFGGFLTPRLHLRYEPWAGSVVRMSIGQGRRTANIFSENLAVFVSNRQLVLPPDVRRAAYGLDQEVATNFGLNYTQDFTLFGKEATWGVEYYRTEFINQIVVDRDSDPQEIRFYNLNGESYSNSVQVEVNYLPSDQWELRAAYRWLDVKTTYGENLLQRPMIAEHRIFTNAAFKPGKGWSFDATLSWFGPKRLPRTDQNPVGFRARERSPDMFIMLAQINKELGNGWHIYLGGENLLNVQQTDPIISAEQPFGEYFDASLAWGPIFGRMVYAGVKLRLN